jgi:hypothetical protein
MSNRLMADPRSGASSLNGAHITACLFVRHNWPYVYELWFNLIHMHRWRRNTWSFSRHFGRVHSILDIQKGCCHAEQLLITIRRTMSRAEDCCAPLSSRCMHVWCRSDFSSVISCTNSFSCVLRGKFQCVLDTYGNVLALSLAQCNSVCPHRVIQRNGMHQMNLSYVQRNSEILTQLW